MTTTSTARLDSGLSGDLQPLRSPWKAGVVQKFCAALGCRVKSSLEPSQFLGLLDEDAQFLLDEIMAQLVCRVATIMIHDAPRKHQNAKQRSEQVRS